MLSAIEIGYARQEERRMEKKFQNENQKIDEEIKAIMSGDADAAPDRGAGRKPRRNKRYRRLLVLLLLLAAALTAGKIFLAGEKKSAPFVETAALSAQDITESLTVTGPVEGTDSVDVTSSLHAKVTELNVKEGDRVTAGETILARLDTTELAKEVEASQGNYDLAVAQRDEKVKTDNESYQKAIQDLNAAQTEYNRQAALAQTGDISQAELEKAQNALNDAGRTAASFQVKNGKVQPDRSAEIQISNASLALRQAQDKLKDAVITAPISGTVTRVNTKVGQFADDLQDKKPMITIENLDELQMEIQVSEYSIGKVVPGQPVRITADILGKDHFVQGEVVSISPTGEEKGNGSTERVIPTKIRITEPDTALIAGITAKAQIELDKAENAWVVPISAVGDDGTGQAVLQFAEKDSATGKYFLHSVLVKTGLESDINVEIAGTVRKEDAHFLAEGSLYLPAYQAGFADGTEVSVKEAGASAGDAKTAESVTAESSDGTGVSESAEPSVGEGAAS